MTLIWHRYLFFLGLLAVSALILRLAWAHQHPWARYGVEFFESRGESNELEYIYIDLKRDGRLIRGPQIIGRDLSITYQYRDHAAIPNAVIHSISHDCYAIVGLNLSDPNKHEFEIIEKKDLDISYWPNGVDPVWEGGKDR
jgi:hypothetical protein